MQGLFGGRFSVVAEGGGALRSRTWMLSNPVDVSKGWRWCPGGVWRRGWASGRLPEGGREWPCGQTGAALGRLWNVGGVTARGRGFAVDLVLADRGLNGSECGRLSELPAL